MTSKRKLKKKKARQRKLQKQTNMSRNGNPYVGGGKPGKTCADVGGKVFM